MRTTPEDVGLSGSRLYKIDHLTSRYIEEGRLAGTITLVARRGEVVHFSCQGRMDVEADKEMEEDTIFRIYSMTKPITSVALMMLYEDGHFQLDCPVSRYIPGFKHLKVHTPDGLVDTEREMTIRDLLTHTSGLTYGFMNATPVDAMYRAEGVEQASDLEEMMEKLSDMPLLFTPGSRWSYSVATDVCGYLVQKISDTPFDEFLKEQIFEPLEMVDTGFTVPADQVHRFAANYQHTEEGGFRLIDSPEASVYLKPRGLLSGGGGLVSTAADYNRFAQMLLGRGEYEGTRILGRKTIELMTMNHLPNNGDLTSMGQAVFSETPYDGIGFGLGFSVMLDPAKAQILGSPGEFAWGGAASTYFFVDPAEELVVMLLTQLMPSSAYPIRRELRVLAYQSLIHDDKEA
ncbi:MAG: beta-lactamase family protein [Pseudomonadales bacterium]|nr:beta-lactamase family protein [Pseudomonadales bacterium]